ncbi:hypothetical protein Tco_0584283 [Tanacetum coccineum]
MGSHTLQQLRGYAFDEIKVLFEATVKSVNTFTPMESDDTSPKVVAGSSKRSVEEELDELSQEQLQQLMIIVPEEGMNVEALQTKYPIIDWEVYTEDLRMADVELKDTLVVDIPKFEGEGYTRSTIHIEYKWEPLRSARGPLVGLKLKSNFVYGLIQPSKTSGKKKQDGFTTQEVDDLVNTNSDSEVEEAFNETIGFMASTSSKIYSSSKNGSGVVKKSMYEKWKETYIEDPYDDDDDIDDYGLTEDQLKIANAFDISLCGQLR